MEKLLPIFADAPRGVQAWAVLSFISLVVSIAVAAWYRPTSAAPPPTAQRELPTTPASPTTPTPGLSAKEHSSRDGAQRARASPRIEQRSQGTKSPNIVGNNNTVIYSNAPDALGRRLTVAQIERMKVVLSGKATADIDISFTDGESMHFAEDIATALNSAGWRATTSSAVGGLGGPPPRRNTLIWYAPLAGPKKYMEADHIERLPKELISNTAALMARALANAEIPVAYMVHDNGAPYGVALHIGYQ